ncbi:MAG: transcriptional regulator [Deltaproteobacteria bacterium]|nr:transcriptional regulator [Deltaproteobacteria bacterium]
MSFKFDAMMLILNKIDSGEKVTIESLKNDLEVSERTVHRYLETLQLSGYPLYFDRPKERYLFPEGYTLKQPGLDAEEFLALALAKKVIRRLGPEFEAGLTRIEKKLAGRGAKAAPRILVPEGEAAPRAGFLESLNRAALQFQRVEFSYAALSSKTRTRRRVEPDYLFFQEGLWYLRGYCCLREESRTFALDRMESLKVLEEHFVPRQRSGDEELASSFGSFLDGEPEEVILVFDPEIRLYIERRRWHPSQEKEELKDGRLKIRFRVKGLEGIGRWIYRWLPWVEVLTPKALREKVEEDLALALAKHGGKKGERSKEKGER